jgi:CubicO group peptidase (beta-lactamase class C family)
MFLRGTYALAKDMRRLFSVESRPRLPQATIWMEEGKMARLPLGAMWASKGARRRRGPVAVAALFAVAGLLASASCPPALADPGTASLSAEVDALFAGLTGVDAPGASVIVAKSGEVLHAKGYGLANVELGVPNRTDTVFRLGSITKTFTAMAVLQLHDRGLLDIDDPVAKYLPDAPHADEITIRHLLTHTSGLTSLEDAPLEFAPGERMDYSNAGYHLLGRIIEHVSGDSYEEFLRKSIFAPLGMTGTGYERCGPIVKHRAAGYEIGEGGKYVNAQFQDIALTYSAGALYSTVEDIYLWDRALSADKLLAPETLAQSFSPAALNDGRKTAFGLGWLIGSYRGVRENGTGGDITGFNTWISRFPDHALTVVVLSNTPMRPPGPLPTARDLAHRIAEIYLSDYMEAEKQPTAIALDPALYQRYVGVYKATGAPEVLAVMGDTLTFTTDGSALFVQTKLGKQKLLPETETTFFMIPDDGNRLTFVLDDTGRAGELIISLFWGVREIRAKRVESEPE